MSISAPFSESLSRWIAGRHQAVLVTLRKDGSPQSSNLSYFFAGGRARISVTAGRAKTRNARRDPRVILHILGENFWQYLSIRGTATLGPASESPGCAARIELLEVYQGIAGPHPDPAEYFQAMGKRSTSGPHGHPADSDRLQP